MSNSVAASDVIRSMVRSGFSHDEIYDVLAGTGLPGEQVQLLIDRVAAEFREAKLQPQTSRLGVEVEKVFSEAFEGLRHDLFARIDLVSRKLELMRVEFKKFGMRVVELQTLVERGRLSSTSGLGRKRYRRVDRGVN